MQEKKLYHNNDKLCSIMTMDEKGLLHSEEDKPSLQIWNERGKLIERRWHQHGQIVRAKGPSSERFTDQGKLMEVEYCVPGIVKRWKDMTPLERKVREQGGHSGPRLSFHRVGGPAFAVFDENGTPIREEYWENGVFLNGWRLVHHIQTDTQTERWYKEAIDEPVH